ncbi:MAG: biotin/lipoyl-containing protein [Gemmatimonadaceae bacterium]
MKYIVTVNGERLELERDGELVTEGVEIVLARLAEVEGTPVRIVTIGDAVHRVVVRRRSGRGAYTLWLDGYVFEVEALDERARAIRDLSAAAAVASGPAPLLAPMPGLIVRLKVQPGDQVEAGQGLVVMEAMKMENELRAPAAGRVRRVTVAAGEAVEKGAILVELE